MDKEENDTLISYRLSQLETGLKTVQETLKNISEQLNVLTPLQSRVQSLEAEMEKAKEQIEEIKNAPYKKDAAKWQTVIGWILQSLTLACMAILLAKIGLK